MSNMDKSPPGDSSKHLNIVALETFFTPLPKLSLPEPYTFTLTEYTRTKLDELSDRIRDADILITTVIPLRADTLAKEKCPNLKLIAVLASGVDSIDVDACAARGIRVLNSPNCNTEAVAEHAVAMYFAVRRTLVPSMKQLRAGEWVRRGTLMKSVYVAGKPPRGCRDETVAIIGHGGVGRKVAEMLGGLGMKVTVAGRKGSESLDQGRVAFDEALKNATVIVLSCPRSPETMNLLSTREFALMREDAALVNVARGGIVDEDALLEALREGRIAGAATDVFLKEPAGLESCPLLAPGVEDEGLNLVCTPHTAWLGERTTVNYQEALQENIRRFISELK